MAITQIRNEQVRDLTLEIGKIRRGSEILLSDGTVALAANLNANSHHITNLLDPVNAQDAATKAYVDAVKQGLTLKDAVRAATTENIALDGSVTSVDGVTLVDGNRVLVMNQTDATQNGIYVVSATGWTRATDANTSTEIQPGMYTFVSEGTQNGNNGFVLTTDAPVVMDTTSLTFTQFSGAGQVIAGNGLTKTGNQIDVVTASSARIVVNADSIDLATTAVVAANGYTKFDVDAYGRVTAGYNPTTLSGYGITDAQPLDSDLTAIAGLTTTGIIVRTSDGAADTRTITGTAGNISVTNGDGVAGNPTLNLITTGVGAGEYTKLTVDTFGRVTSATTLVEADIPTLDWSKITGTPTTRSGYGITDAQPLDADLTSLAGLSSLGFVVRSAADTFATRSFSVGTGLSITNSDGTAGGVSISLDGSLSALAGLADTGIIVQTAVGNVAARSIAGTAGNIVVTNGDGVAGNPTVNLVSNIIATPGTYTKLTVDTYGRVTAATAPSDISDLGINNVVRTDLSSTLDAGVFLTLSADPTDALHATTKQYVDGVATGLNLKPAVRVATTENIALDGSVTSIDNIALVDGDRVLVKNQTDATENGIYVVNTSGTWDRSTDADNTPGSEVTPGMFTFVMEGDTNHSNGYVLVGTGPYDLGTSSLAFTQFSGAGSVIAGNGLTKSGNQIDVVTADVNRIVVNANSIDLATTGVSASNYNYVNVDVYGRVTSAFLRTLTSNTTALTITNGDSSAGDPTFDLASNLKAVAGLSSFGLVALTSAGNVAARVISVGTGMSITNADGIAADPSITLDSDLVAIAGLSSTGMIVRTADGSATTRSISVGTGLSIADANGVAGSPTITLDGSLSSLANLATNGIIVQTAAGTVTSRTITSSNSLINIADGNGIAGDPTFTMPLNNGWIIRGNGSNAATAYRSVANEVATTSDNTTYAISYTVVSGTESVFLNGLLQRPGLGFDYTISGGSVVFNSANQAADVVMVAYLATN
jgi:phage-related tail fiber protein